MRRSVDKLVACVLFAVSVSTASTAARATDYSDLWWNPAESGWGLMTSQQGNVMFITLYVFRADRSATWFNGLLFVNTPGGSSYTGQISEASGPFYGGPFAPPAVNRTVGTATFTATSPATATVSYIADGVTVTKTVERYPLQAANLSGTYIGSFLSVKHSCANPTSNGLFNGSGQFTIVHNHPQVAITANLTDNIVSFTCSYQGTYTALGRIGSIAGTYQCTSGQAGAWNASEIELSTLGGILGRYSGTVVAQACQLTGGFGGLKPSN